MFTKRFSHRFTARRGAFTLVEMLITLSIFVVVATISVSLLVNGLRAARKIQAQVLLYSEAQALMDQLARNVERGSVDYEAYYSREVKLATGWETPNYGQYAQSFYNPGNGGVDPGPYDDITGDLYKTPCPSHSTLYYPKDCPTETPVSTYEDTDTGVHPFTGIDNDPDYVRSNSDSMNAFCEVQDDGTECTEFNNAVQDELILINRAGDLRTVYALEQMDTAGEYYLSKVLLDGTDGDGDGVVDTWACTSTYDCTATDADGNSVPNLNDLTDGAEYPLQDFSALSPESLSVSDFHVIIAPLESPYLAFGEHDQQIQPQITIVMTVTLSSNYSASLLGTVPSITIQRTVSTGAYSKIPSYE